MNIQLLLLSVFISFTCARPADVTGSTQNPSSQQPQVNIPPVVAQPGSTQQPAYNNFPPPPMPSSYGPVPFGPPPFPPPPPPPPFGSPPPGIPPPPFMTQYCNESTVSCHWTQPVESCCSPSFGLVVLTREWTIDYGPSNDFTIQQFKPSGCGGELTPTGGCDQTRVSNQIGQIVKMLNSTLFDRLNTFWPSESISNNELWSDQWIQHGTCISTLHPRCYGSAYTKFEDVIAYFETAVDLSSKYNITQKLDDGGVKPGQKYSTADIRTTLENSFKAKVQLDCNADILQRVSLYFNVIGRDGYILTDAPNQGTCKDVIKYLKK